MRSSLAKSSPAMRVVVLGILSILSGSSFAMDETVSGLAGELPPTSYPPSMPMPMPMPMALPQASRFSALINPNDPGQMMGAKRGYVYRSEYKRLPLYQFGLGKRWVYGLDDKGTLLPRPINPFSIYGPGKRTKHYNFGVGKRSSPEDLMDNSLYSPIYNDDYSSSYNPYMKDWDDYLEAKRTGGFNFGLGKRVPMINEEARLLEKRLRDKYLFGLGKKDYVETSEEVEDEEE